MENFQIQSRSTLKNIIYKFRKFIIIDSSILLRNNRLHQKSSIKLNSYKLNKFHLSLKVTKYQLYHRISR